MAKATCSPVLRKNHLGHSQSPEGKRMQYIQATERLHGCPDGFPATVWKQQGAHRRMNITVGTYVDKCFITTEIPTNTLPPTKKE